MRDSLRRFGRPGRKAPSAVAVAVTTVVCAGSLLGAGAATAAAPVKAVAPASAPSAGPTGAGGDWSSFRNGPARLGVNPSETVLNPSNVAGLSPAWQAATDSDARSSAAVSSPAVVGDVAYVGSYDHKIYAVAARTGAVLWTADTGGPVESSPAVADGVVYVGSNYVGNDVGKVYALSATTGQVLWTFTADGKVTSSPVVVDGVVYVGSMDNNLYAINATTGEMIWGVYTERYVRSSPAVVGGVVYVGLYGFQNGSVQARSAATGEVIWTTPGDPVVSTPAVVDGVVYVNEERGGAVKALDAATGAVRWTAPTGVGGATSSPAVGNGVVYVSSGSHAVFAFGAANGALLWQSTGVGTGSSSPALANGVVYVGGYGAVYALAANTGTVLWTGTTGGDTSSPAVSHGVVYVGWAAGGSVGAAGALDAFRLTAPPPPATPTLTTKASRSVSAGGRISDSATLAGGAGPTGTITFRLYGPGDTTCATAIATSTATVSGNGTYSSAPFTTMIPGTYRWRAGYSGDAANDSAGPGSCADGAETVVVGPSVPTPCRTTATGMVTGPVVVTAGRHRCFVNATVKGSITVNPSGELTVTASTVTGGITSNGARAVDLCGNNIGPGPSGTALSVTDTSGPIRIGDPPTGCNGNNIRGGLNLANNYDGLVLGSNSVHAGATVNANKGGPIAIRYNLIDTTLACAANTPAPTDSGQANTAAAKTGQCASL